MLRHPYPLQSEVHLGVICSNDCLFQIINENERSPALTETSGRQTLNYDRSAVKQSGTARISVSVVTMTLPRGCFFILRG